MLTTLTAGLPPSTVDPSGAWFFNWVIPIGGSLFIVAAVADTVRRRRLTWGFLFLLNSLLVYWMEWRRWATGGRCCSTARYSPSTTCSTGCR